ncbi:helix-turn-helix domain-containing protein [Niveispirillum sp. SYP-B3756]|uniref:helix-turn-helix domain-containing protein n=1 Tax=Niveispirillum sp. SYP-B3756 TaxID=2662178 RepID=UPI0012926BA2|nr:helix-turn-helix transcriptional regulator [Niveispirillum sp. SYP-B3756]MQP68167.1 helix-turn-helix domain-containing protein [Niveispirillum sp. SYP-B3756]
MATALSSPELDNLAVLGQSLRLARRRRNLTQDEMADRMGVSRPTYSQLERGSATVGLGILLRAMTVLGYPERIGGLLAEDPIGDAMDDASGRQRIRKPHGLADF